MRGWLVLLLGGIAMAASFAAFTVEPKGDQEVDLTTGITTLPQGGRLIDNDSGVALEAALIRYKEGEFVEAEEARLSRNDLRFRVGKLEYLVEQKEVRLSGGVTFSSDFLEGLKADRGVLFMADDVAVLEGGVRSTSPAFEAQRLVADTREGLVLLVGDFRYEDPALGLVLRGKGESARLLITFVQGKEPEATTEVPAKVRSRLEAYLAEAEPN